MTALVKYEAARRALAAARAVDEVKDIRDKAEAMRVYARQAKDRQLEIDDAEIRIRAERRLGEMIQAQKKTVGLNVGAKGSIVTGTSGGPLKIVTGTSRGPLKDDRPTLADAGISKNLSSRAQKLAAVPEDKFEELVGEWRGKASASDSRIAVSLTPQESADQAARNGKTGSASSKKTKTLPPASAAKLRKENELLEAELTEAKLELNELRTKNDELEERIAFVQGESKPVAAVREEKFNNYRAHIQTLKHSVYRWQTQFQESNAENKALRRRLRALGENIRP